MYKEYAKHSEKLIQAYTNNIYVHEVFRQNKTVTPRECRINGDYIMFRGHTYPNGKSGGRFVTKTTDLSVGYDHQNDQFRLGHFATINSKEGHKQLHQRVVHDIYAVSYPYYLYSIRMNVADLFQPDTTMEEYYRAIRAEMRDKGICRLTYKCIADGTLHLNDMNKADGHVDLDTKNHWVIVSQEHYQRLYSEITYDGEVKGVPKVKNLVLHYGDKFKQPEFQGRIDTVDVVAMEPCNNIDNMKEWFTPEYYTLDAATGGVKPIASSPYLLIAVISGIILLAIGGFLFQVADR